MRLIWITAALCVAAHRAGIREIIDAAPDNSDD
jgi:hypothetical protein